MKLILTEFCTIVACLFAVGAFILVDGVKGCSDLQAVMAAMLLYLVHHQMKVNRLRERGK